MTTETIVSTLAPELLGMAIHRHEVREDRVIVPDNGVFIVPVYNLDTGLDIEPIPTVPFSEFALRMTDGDDDKYIPCLVPTQDGDLEETKMFVDYWIDETYFPGDEPRFLPEQRRKNKRIAESVLLNIIDGRP